MKINYYILGAVLLCISCSGKYDEEKNTSITKIVLDIKQPINNITGDDSSLTRATDAGSGTNMIFTFEHADSVGIFSKGGSQIPFPIPLASGQTSTSVAILAEGWMTKLNDVYSVYLPYDFYNRHYDHIPWDGRKIIRQATNNSKAHIGKYWFAASDTVVQNNTDGIFHTSLNMFGTEVRVRVSVSVAGQYVRMMLVSPQKSFSTYGYYDLFDKANGQPYHSLGESDHVTLTINSPNLSAVGKQVVGFFYFPETNVNGQTMGCYIWDSNGNCYYSSVKASGLLGLWNRNTANDLTFPAANLVTTPTISLNPWENSENICPTCTPVAF